MHCLYSPIPVNRSLHSCGTTNRGFVQCSYYNPSAFFSYYIRLVFADETVLCFLYDDFSATDLGKKATTMVPQQSGV
jgi:hypothetical protein